MRMISLNSNQPQIKLPISLVNASKTVIEKFNNINPTTIKVALTNVNNSNTSLNSNQLETKLPISLVSDSKTVNGRSYSLNPASIKVALITLASLTLLGMSAYFVSKSTFLDNNTTILDNNVIKKETENFKTEIKLDHFKPEVSNDEDIKFPLFDKSKSAEQSFRQLSNKFNSSNVFTELFCLQPTTKNATEDHPKESYLQPNLIDYFNPKVFQLFDKNKFTEQSFPQVPLNTSNSSLKEFCLQQLTVEPIKVSHPRQSLNSSSEQVSLPQALNAFDYIIDAPLITSASIFNFALLKPSTYIVNAIFNAAIGKKMKCYDNCFKALSYYHENFKSLLAAGAFHAVSYSICENNLVTKYGFAAEALSKATSLQMMLPFAALGGIPILEKIHSVVAPFFQSITEKVVQNFVYTP